MLALEHAIACTENELAGWLAVRTEAMPEGDKEGAGNAAFRLAGFALELDKFERRAALAGARERECVVYWYSI